MRGIIMRLRLLPLLILVAPALGQEPKLPDGVRLRLGTDKFREAAYINAAALSPDGKRVAVYSSGQTIRILDVATGAELRRFPLREALRTQQLLFTPDGKQLVTGGYNGVNLWDAESGRLVSTVANTARDGRDGTLHLSADGKTVAVGNQYQNGSVKILDLHASALVTTLKPAHNSAVQGAVSPDGKRVAVWGQHYGRGNTDESAVARTVQVFDAKTGAETAKLVTDVPVPQSVRFSPDGTKLAVGGSGTVQLWDVATGKAERRFAGRTGQGWQLAFSPDGKLLSAAGPDGSVQTWEAATGKRAAVCEGPAAGVTGLQYRPDGQLVAWAVRSHALDIWEVPSGKRLTPDGGNVAPVTALHFSPDDRTLISIAQDGRVLRWDTATGKELGPFELKGRDGPRPLPPQNGPVHFSPDGKYLIANGNGHSTASVWDTATGLEQFALTSPQPNGYLDRSGLFAFAADSSRLAVVSRYGRDKPAPVPVWDLETGLPRPGVTGPQGDYSAAAFSTDGAILALAAQVYPPRGTPSSEVWACDSATGQPVSKVTVPNVGIGGIRFLDDRLYVPLVHAVQGLKVYDALSGQEVRTLEGFVNPSPQAVVLSPDRRLLAVGTQAYSVARDGPPSGLMVRVYETATGSARHDLAGQTGRVTTVAFSRDGKTLAVGCSDTTILLWDLTGPPEKTGPLSPTDLTEQWAVLDLAGAKPAERAMRKLAARPAESVPYLAGQVKPAPASEATPELLAKLIADLDAPRFAVREAASQKLERLGNPARAAVVEALKRTDLAAEVRERLEKLKVKLDQPTSLDEWVRPLRAIEVLERVGSPEAVAHLKVVAGGGDAATTRAAKAALGRLNR
jgi:WD40 repeat protein